MDTEAALETSAALPQGIADCELEKYLYLAPLGIIPNHAAKALRASGQGRGLAGDKLAFAAWRMFFREEKSVTSAVGGINEIAKWAREEGLRVESYISALTKGIETPRPAFARTAGMRSIA